MNCLTHCSTNRLFNRTWRSCNYVVFVFVILVFLRSFHQYIKPSMFETRREAPEANGHMSVSPFLDNNALETEEKGEKEERDEKEDIVEAQSEETDDEEQIFDANVKYHGHDLMNDPPKRFNPNFKNPCWYKGKQFRCLPYVFLIGVKKSGTSDLFMRTSKHPDFINPGFKEAQWFARGRFGTNKDNLNTYINMFKSAAQSILKGANKSSNTVQNFRQITGEASPSNLHLNTHWKYLPGNENMDEPKYVILDYIRHILPKAKILITFRDPVERLYSDYYHEYGTLREQNTPNPQEFHSVVTKGVQSYKDCFQHHTIRSCVYNVDLYQTTRIQIQLGIYYIFWQDLLRNFPRHQILVVQNKNLHDPKATMKSVYKFLDLRELSTREMHKIVNAKEKHTRNASYVEQGPMMNETFKILHDFYAPFNKRMAEVTGDSDFLYV